MYIINLINYSWTFLGIFLSCLHFHVFSAFIGVKFSFICKISQNYTDIRYLLDIKLLSLLQVSYLGDNPKSTHSLPLIVCPLIL